MRRSSLRLASAAGLSVGVAALAALPVPTAAQPQPVPPAAAAKAAAKDKSDTIDVMIFPADRDAKEILKAISDYLREFKDKSQAIPWDKVCPRVQQVLDAKSDTFFEFEEKDAAGNKAVRRVSAKAEANRLIADFPKDGRQFYQLTFGPTAKTMLDEAVKANYETNLLADVSQRYFHTRAGGEATLMLAVAQLERGNFAEAAYSFDRLLARPDKDDFLTPRTLFRAALAFKRSGDADRRETFTKLWQQLERKFPRDGLALGRRTYSVDDLKAELDRPFEHLYGKIGESYLATRFGNVSHTSVADGGPPFLDASFTVPMLFRTEEGHQEGTQWIKQNLAEVLKNKDYDPARQVKPVVPAFFPVTAPGLILYRNYDGVYAVVTKDGYTAHGRAFKAGEILWISSTKSGLHALMSDDERSTALQWWTYYSSPQAGLAGILFENPLVGSLTHDGVNAYVVDDLAVPQPPLTVNPEFGGFQQQIVTTAGGQLRNKAEANRLVAINIETGKIDWELGGSAATNLTEEEEEKTGSALVLTRNAFFLGPPLPLNGKLYVLYERNKKMKLACLDPNKIGVHKGKNAAGQETAVERYPELVWVQKLGDPTLELPKDSFRRFQCSYLAYADGVIVCPTNAGAVVAVDVMNRSLLWAHSYRTIPKPPAPDSNEARQMLRRGVNPAGVDITGGLSKLNQDRWRSGAPIVSRGRVVFSAFDSDAVDCLDLRTGKVLWTAPREKGELYVGGIVNDKVLVVGKNTVRAVELTGEDEGSKRPKVAWRDVKIGMPAGHGVASKGGLYYLPVAFGPDTQQPEVWAVNVNTGAVVSKTAYRKQEAAGETRPMLGNLVFHEGQLFSQSPYDVSAFPLIELKKTEMDRLLRDNPNDPIGLAARGELFLDNGRVKEAVADFKASQKNNPPEAVGQKIKDKLYLAYTELLRADFPANEQYLPEYETLAAVAVDADDPNLRDRQKDERLRRMGTYLSVLARGRERQGRLAEAFDHYRAFAALGENGQLVSVHDEPNGSIRPDVWARGRIEAMIRGAKDPAARKPLDDRVAADWAKVKAADDLPRLREFVAVFGPFFGAGREAQLALAEKLLETAGDDSVREAQTHLLQVRAGAEDRRLVARAVECLARLYTKKGLLEDAVGLYSQLGTEYADVPVRDGKTGADFLAGLITDRRLTAHLEPTRFPLPKRVKVEQLGGAGGRFEPQGFVFEPEGDLLPFYRRFRLMLQMDGGGGGWTLRVTDRTTGADWHRFTGLRWVNATGVPAYRIAQAYGHTLLVHLGQFVYCYDLAEKKLLWEHNLFGTAGADPTPGGGPQFEPGGGDENSTLALRADGFTIRLGRSSVLAATHACLLTRDGLVAVDPVTKGTLWTRTNVAPNAQIFGDDKHVFLVEGGPGGPTHSKVLRAADGSVVDGVPDFGKLYTGKGRKATFGRLLLLNDEQPGKPSAVRLYDPLAGRDVWRKEYPEAGRLFDTRDPQVTGYLAPDGRFEVFDSRNGAVAFTGRTDPGLVAEHVTDAKFPLLLSDGDRYYVVLNRSGEADRSMRNFVGFSYIRMAAVSGAVYCFDRATGERLWYADRQLENQWLVLERFRELPALVTATQIQEDGGNNYVYRVAVLDKLDGRLHYLKNLTNNNGPFFSVTDDPKAGAVQFFRGDLSLRVGPDEDAKGR